MERSSTFDTFACLAERAARHQTVIRRSQMRKAVYFAATTPAIRTFREVEGYV
ncbi:hypothetical protein [Methanoculleus sp.]|uniref:hypothetical protein n=1 Tax=Methanoculleus sp. TaxID=90427 RepID=UPI002FC8D0BB